MAKCKKCHMSMTKEKLSRHEKDCIPMGKKSFENYTVCKGFAVDEHGVRITRR